MVPDKWKQRIQVFQISLRPTKSATKSESVSTKDNPSGGPSTNHGHSKISPTPDESKDSQGSPKSDEDVKHTGLSLGPEVSQNAVDEPDSPANGKVQPQPETLEATPEEAASENPSPLNDAASRSERSAEERSIPQLWTPEKAAARLWAIAYDELQAHSPELVLEYERTVIDWLTSHGIYPKTPGRRPSVASFLDMEMLSDEWFVRPPLSLVVTIVRGGAKEDSKQEADRESLSISHCEPEVFPAEINKEENRMTCISMEECLRDACEVSPHATMAWAATYITHQSFFRPASRTEAVRSQVASLISKMEWFTELSRLFYWPNQADPPLPSTGSPVDALVTLYASVLACHMHATVSFDLNMGQKQPQASPLTVALDELQACEVQLARRFNQLHLQSLVKQRLGPAIIIDSCPTSDRDLQRVLAALKTDQQLTPDFDADQISILHSFYDWAHGTPEFRKFITWDDEDLSRLLRVDGPPGAGKSMVLQAAVRCLPDEAKHSEKVTRHAAYAFYDFTVRGQSGVLSILKSLISGLLLKQPGLVKYLDLIMTERNRLDDEGDVHLLSNVFYKMISDDHFISTYFVVDGVDPLVTQDCAALDNAIGIVEDPTQKLLGLQRLISTTMGVTKKVKWLLSFGFEVAKGNPETTSSHQELRLLLDGSNSNGLQEIAKEYATMKIAKICKKPGYNASVKEALIRQLKCAKRNFLFIDIALDIVSASMTPWNAITTLGNLVANEASIHGVYRWNYDFIDKLPSEDSVYCRDILYATTVAQRPLLISELIMIVDLPPENELFLVIEKLLPAFLEIRDEKVCFKHLSAMTFIQHDMGESSLRTQCSKFAQQCLKNILRNLDCRCANSCINAKTPETAFRLTAILWVQHLSKLGGDNQDTITLAVHLFNIHLIDWLNVLDERGLIADALSMMFQLNDKIKHAPLNIHNEEVRSATQIFREVTTFIIYYQRWSTMPEEERQSGEGSTAMSPEQRLLFAKDLPLLRTRLLPIVFPKLQSVLCIGRSDAQGECRHVLKHKDWVRSCCFSPDGRTIASASDERCVCIWDARTGRKQQVLEGFESFALGVVISFSPSLNDGAGGDLIAAFDKKTIKVWDPTTESLLNTLTVDMIGDGDGTLGSIALSQAGGMLAAAVDNDVVLWQPLSDSPPRILSDTSDVRRVVLSPDGSFLAFSVDSTVKVCYISSLDNPERLEGNLVPEKDEALEAEEHPERSEGRSTATIQDEEGEHMSGSDDSTARVWDMKGKKTVAILEYHQIYINDVSFSPDGSWIATASGDTTIALWKHKSPGNWGRGEIRKQPDHVLRGHRRSVRSVFFSPTPCGLLLASSSTDHDVRIWDLEEVDEVMRTEQPADTGDSKGHGSPVSCIAISWDGHTIASASYDGVVCLWNSHTGTLRCMSETSHDGEVLSMTFPPDNELLVTASIDGTAYVWEVSRPSTSLKPSFRLKHDNWVRNAKFDRKGQLLATGSDDQFVRVYDISAARAAASTTADTIEELEATTTLKKHSDYVYGVAFSRDSKRLVSGGDDTHVMVWELDLHKKVSETPRFDMESRQVQSTIRDVEFSADETSVLSVSRDGTIAVWRFAAPENYDCRIIKDQDESGFGTFMSIRIDAQFPQVLFTELGVRRFNVDECQNAEARDGYHDAWRPPGWLPISLDKSGQSILYDANMGDGQGEIVSPRAKNTIFLPSQFTMTGEPYSCRVQGDIVVVGCISGHVLVFRFVEQRAKGEIEEDCVFGRRIDTIDVASAVEV
ncbi:wd-repeat protein [Fusarium austroafricanum]|uniref:Wd-repeat protein n=1 Tax=Fusarium austroafricanum TaxID=2364996 RepID=A0A8H4KM99_9HYPO|nr:wd-repeat protein [Fusarium austroafricanum]